MMILRYIHNFITNPSDRMGYLSRLGFYNNCSDEKYIRKLFKIHMGYDLDLDTPKTFNEKIQWLKLHDRKPIYTTMVDKYTAKQYVADRIGEEYIIPTLGVWDKFEDIDFDALPNQFVLKCTHDSGGLVICRDKSSFDKQKAKEKIERSLKKNYYWSGREWPYKNVKPRIIAEQYMEDTKTEELRDYKFFCFDGVAKALFIATDRQKEGEGLTDYKFFCFDGCVRCLYVSKGSHTDDQKLQFFDKDFTPMDCRRKDYKQYEVLPDKPKNFDLMIEIAEKLSQGIPHVRVDLYEINGKIYFGELTLFTGSGYIPFEQEEWDYKFGEWINLPGLTPAK